MLILMKIIKLFALFTVNGKCLMISYLSFEAENKFSDIYSNLTRQKFFRSFLLADIYRDKRNINVTEICLQIFS